VLTDTRLSESRLQEELLRFRDVIHPSIAGRVHFLMGRPAGKSASSAAKLAFSGSLPQQPAGFDTWLGQLVATERLAGQAPQKSARQRVIAALAQLRLCNHPPVTIKRLQEICGVSYPTVASVLQELATKGWLQDTGERGVRLRPLSAGEWMDLARDHSKQRRAAFFTDPTGQASPEQLARRLQRLQGAGKLRQGVRIGGVMGATHHFPALDITAAPRLDLSVDGDPLAVASLLDAGLVPKTQDKQHAVLAVHVNLDPWGSGERTGPNAGPWAGELECLADLIEAGYEREAAEMAQDLASNTQRAGEPG